MPLMLFHTRLQHSVRCSRRLIRALNASYSRASLHPTAPHRFPPPRNRETGAQLLMQCRKASPALLVEGFIHASTSAKSCLHCLSIVLTQLAESPSQPSRRLLKISITSSISLPTVRRWPHTIGKRSGHRGRKVDHQLAAGFKLQRTGERMRMSMHLLMLWAFFSKRRPSYGFWRVPARPSGQKTAPAPVQRRCRRSTRREIDLFILRIASCTWYIFRDIPSELRECRHLAFMVYTSTSVLVYSSR